MGYDRSDRFPFDFEPNGKFHLIQKSKDNCHRDHIPFNLKGNAKNPSRHHRTMVSRGLRKALNRTPLCREAQTSQTTEISFYSLCFFSLFFGKFL